MGVIASVADADAPRFVRRREDATGGNAPALLVLVGSVVSLTAVAALVTVIGSDSGWLVALGRFIHAHGEVPARLPFAPASERWANPLVLAELIFHGADSSLGARGLLLAQLMAVAIAFAALARDAVAGGATARRAAGAMGLVALGALPSLCVIRAQLFSVALFPLLLLLLRSDARAPSKRIWLLIPLLALWSNFDGVAVIGLAVTGLYLGLSRLRIELLATVAVGTAALGAMFLTPAGLDTPTFYREYLTSVPAQRGLGLSATLSLTKPFDLLLIGAALILAMRFRRVRPPVWEVAAVIVLTAATVHASRSGVWLLMVMAAPAARATNPRTAWDRLLPALGLISVVAVAYAIVRGPLPTGASPTILRRAVEAAGATPILADDLIDEQLAVAGGHIWAGNPIEAFSKPVQIAYLDWLEGLPSGRAALRPGISVVVTAPGSAAQKLMTHASGFVRVFADRTAAIYLRQAS